MGGIGVLVGAAGVGWIAARTAATVAGMSGGGGAGVSVGCGVGVLVGTAALTAASMVA